MFSSSFWADTNPTEKMLNSRLYRIEDPTDMDRGWRCFERSWSGYYWLILLSDNERRFCSCGNLTCERCYSQLPRAHLTCFYHPDEAQYAIGPVLAGPSVPFWECESIRSGWTSHPAESVRWRRDTRMIPGRMGLALTLFCLLHDMCTS